MTNAANNTTVTKAMVLVVGSDNIMKNIKSIETKGKTLDALIHLTACSILQHVQKNREVSLANKLCAAMPKSARKNALIDWFCTFGEMAYDEKSKAMVFVKDCKTELEKAQALPFWEFKPEAPYHVVDLTAAIAKLVKQAVKRQEEIDAKVAQDAAYVAPDKIDADVLTALKALCPAS